MNKFINIAIVGLGQIGNYLYNELNIKKKKIRIKQEKKLKLVLILRKVRIKKENLKKIRKFFIQIL